MAKQSTSEYYKKNPEARKRRLKQQAKLNATKKEKDRRVALLKINKRNGTNGNGDDKDWSHKQDGTVENIKASENRKHNGSGKRSRYHA